MEVAKVRRSTMTAGSTTVLIWGQSLAHWGMPDPAAVEGDEAARRAAFVDTLTLISRRIDLLLSVPLEKLNRLAVEARVRAIGQEGEVPLAGQRELP